MPRPNKPRTIDAERHVAQRVEIERKRLGWSKATLAKHLTRAGCSIATTAIHRMERGERQITVDELVALSDVCGVPVKELLGPLPDSRYCPTCGQVRGDQ